MKLVILALVANVVWHGNVYSSYPYGEYRIVDQGEGQPLFIEQQQTVSDRMGVMTTSWQHANGLFNDFVYSAAIRDLIKQTK